MSRISSIGYLLQHVSFVLAKQSEQVLQEQLGIGFSQFKILRTLQINPKTKQKEIASRLGQTEASISRQVKLMLEEGLLTTKVNPTNKREHLTVATPKGERLTEAAIEALSRYHLPNFDVLSEREQNEFYEYLLKIHGKTCPCPHVMPLENNR